MVEKNQLSKLRCVQAIDKILNKDLKFERNQDTNDCAHKGNFISTGAILAAILDTYYGQTPYSYLSEILKNRNAHVSRYTKYLSIKLRYSLFPSVLVAQKTWPRGFKTLVHSQTKNKAH